MLNHLLTKIILVVLGLYIALNLFALFGAERLLLVPLESTYTHMPNEVKIDTGNGQQITAVYLHNPDAKYTILFNHGNANDLERIYPAVAPLHDLGVSVLMYDYRGYGTSEGKASVKHVKQDALAAYTWLTEAKGVPADRIIVQGTSLGGGVSTWLAASHPVAALITECTFVSAFRVKTHVPLLPWDQFRNLKAMPSIQCPKLIMHGTADKLIPFWHGEKLYEAAAEPKQFYRIENAGHNDYIHIAGDAYWNRVADFIATLP